MNTRTLSTGLTVYAARIADGGRRLVERQQRLLCRDSHGNNCWEAFWMSMRAQPALFEINTTGLMIDSKKVDELTDVYMGSKAELEQRIRDWARWPELNLNSTFQVRELLFGEALNGKPRDPATNEPVRLRPKGALSLKLAPIMTTDKRPMLWPVVIERELEAEKTPSTNKMALAILAQECQEVVRWHAKQEKYVKYDLSKYVNWIRDYRFISQVLKSVLRPPDLNEAEDGFETDEDGNYSYSGGLPSKICDDQRVRTHIWPTKETGRWSSSNPSAQGRRADGRFAPWRQGRLGWLRPRRGRAWACREPIVSSAVPAPFDCCPSSVRLGAIRRRHHFSIAKDRNHDTEVFELAKRA